MRPGAGWRFHRINRPVIIIVYRCAFIGRLRILLCMAMAGPFLPKADLQDPAEIQIAKVAVGIEQWEVDFTPSVTGSALTLGEFSILGVRKPSWVNRVEQRIDYCGGTLTLSAAKSSPVGDPARYCRPRRPARMPSQQRSARTRLMPPTVKLPRVVKPLRLPVSRPVMNKATA